MLREVARQIFLLKALKVKRNCNTAMTSIIFCDQGDIGAAQLLRNLIIGQQITCIPHIVRSQMTYSHHAIRRLNVKRILIYPYIRSVQE